MVRRGSIIDGSGSAPVIGDIAVSDGRIVAVGEIAGRGAEEVDAEGLAVTPGFIDGHTHMDAQVFWNPQGTSASLHGITTAVMGNCGFTLAPVRPGSEELVTRSLERAEDISADAMREGITWTWGRFRDYLDAVDALPKAINYAAYIGHSALRAWAMGERAFTSAATDDELRAMRVELIDAISAGAIGLSTSLSPDHLTSNDLPVASRLASWEEVTTLVKTVGESGGRMFELALAGAARESGQPAQASFFNALKRLAIDTGVTVTFGVVPSMWSGDLQRLIDEAVKGGGKMYGQSHSRGITLISSFLTHLPFDKLPVWSELRKLPLERQFRELQDPTVRQDLVREAHRGTYPRVSGVELPRPDFETLLVLRDTVGSNPSVAQLARERRTDPVEVILDLALETEMSQMFVQPMRGANPAALEGILADPNCVMTFSDSGAHVSQIIDSSIHTYLLAHWVRDQGKLSLEEAVRMLTSVPARIWGFDDRGLLQPGKIADLNILDPEAIAPDLPTVAEDLPGGGRRLVQGCTGIHRTMVAGVTTFLNGEHTGAFPGRLIRSVPKTGPS